MEKYEFTDTKNYRFWQVAVLVGYVAGLIILTFGGPYGEFGSEMPKCFLFGFPLLPLYQHGIRCRVTYAGYFAGWALLDLLVIAMVWMVLTLIGYPPHTLLF